MAHAHHANAFGNPEDAIIDFHEKSERDQVVRDAEAAGLRLVGDHRFLPQRHFVVLA